MDARRGRTLVVVADGSRARFLAPSKDRRTLVSAGHGEMTAAEARRPSRDLLTDRPGRGSNSAVGGLRHAFEPPTNVHKQQKHNFVARVADVLDKAREADEYDRLVLVASRRSLGELRTLLSARVKKSLAHEIPKDLTAFTPDAVRKALVARLGDGAGLWLKPS
jgi:protein required for attachment to host cells